MHTKEWGSDIETAVDEQSFMLFHKSRNRGWFIPMALLPIALSLSILLGTLVFNNNFFTPAFLFGFPLLIINVVLWFKMLRAIPIGTDVFLYFSDNKMQYKNHNRGYISIEHSITAIHKVSLTENEQFIQIHLYNNRVIEHINIPIKYPKEARLLVEELNSFLQKKGLSLAKNV